MSDSITTTIGSYLGYISMVLMGIGSIVALVNRRRLRSSCCGHEATVSLEIDSTSPKPSVRVDDAVPQPDPKNHESPDIRTAG